MSSPTHADIIDKIQKLRVLAHNKAATPGEVDAALRAMSALMARYRVSEAELEDASKKSEVIESEDLWPAEKRVPSWRIVFLNEIGHTNGVLVTVCAYPNGTRGVRLAGTASDIAIVKSLWSWLEPEAIRLSWGPVPASRKARLRKSQKDWIIGFAVAVAEQLENELKKPVVVRSEAAAAPHRAALVLLDRRTGEAKAWLMRHEDAKPLHVLKGQKADALSLAQGFEAGQRYHLGKKLSKGEPA